MEEGEKVENARERATERGHHRPPAEALDILSMLHGLNQVLRVEYRGELIPAGCGQVLAIIQQENIRSGKACNAKRLNSQFGTLSHVGRYVSILERKGLIIKPKLNAYLITIEGEILLKSICTELNRLLHGRPTRRKIKKARQPKRQAPAIETFNALVYEVLSKAGLNQRVKYALLRALGMSKDETREALQQLAPLTHTERIKPILKSMLSALTHEGEQKP